MKQTSIMAIALFSLMALQGCGGGGSSDSGASTGVDPDIEAENIAAQDAPVNVPGGVPQITPSDAIAVADPAPAPPTPPAAPVEPIATQ